MVRPWEEPSKEWPVYGVNNDIGVFFSHKQKGKAFNAPYKRIRKDWFFHNPTRANVGSLGRVPSVPSDAITSPEYQVWRTKEGLTPDFMEVLLRMPFFQSQVEFHRVGAVKERLFTENLLQIRIPTVSIESQEQIVIHWRTAQEFIARSFEIAEAIELEVRNGVLQAIGLKPPTKMPDLPKAFALRWKDMSRWSIEYLARVSAGLEQPAKGRFPSVPLSEVTEGRSGGTPSTKQSRYWGGTLPWISPKDMKILEIRDSEDHLTEYAVKENATTLVPENSILLVVRSGILQRTVPVAITRVPAAINQDLRAFTIKDSRLLPGFLLHFLNAQQDKLLRLVKYSTTVQSINKEELEAFPIPLPPLDIQKEILDRVSHQRARLAEERKSAEARQARTISDLEEMILGVAPDRRLNV